MAENNKVLSLTNRSLLYVSGVTEVVGFDSTGAQIVTEDGELFVEGEGIRLSNLDAQCGEVSISGRINAIIYKDKVTKTRGGLMGRLFR